MSRTIRAVAGVAVLLLIAGCAGSTPSISADQSPTPGSDSTIQVAGTGSADAEPNQAVVRVSVVAAGSDAATARQRLAANTSRMRTALADAGVGDDRVSTVRYDIYQDRRRPPKRAPNPASSTVPLTPSNSL
ncbi:SIMPL domain-containing protein [Haloplanus litoreus]|uniref:SIMPL domain-containing protein n=1 Tax=Haloplanus litoreus TaxID=767515 RepID=UPI00360E07C8